MTAPERPFEDLEEGFRRVAGEYLKQARKAKRQNHPVEAAMCQHLATRLSKPITSLEEVFQRLDELTELSSWMPVQTRLRKLSLVERKVLLAGRARSLHLPEDYENAVMKRLLHWPGRPPAAREVAVRALEQRMKGKPWKEIEPSLLPHRQLKFITNPGVSIDREVEFLTKVLERYGVRLQNDRNR